MELPCLFVFIFVIISEYDEESRILFRRLERLQLKMADFQNHRCFTLRCLDEEVIPVSIRLKSQVKTPKGFQIIRKAEIALLNERIRSINCTINMLGLEVDTCMKRLREKIKEQDLDRCLEFIKDSKEARHLKTMSRQKEKLKILTKRKLEAKQGCRKKWPAQTTGIVADTCIAAILTLAVQLRSLVQGETMNALTGEWRKVKISGLSTSLTHH